ncbi:hypothetical protein FSY45_24965 [Comamonas sp. Z1]|uniref:hypothetical protein n=1 Tax=Comamonas TaxID=283 RepID=UPI0011E86C46|nr:MULTISPECIES: hypothetical protein [Comamonas]TYK70313.1 hypothetical protein FSY45_24965 [Comamonas sp. Z1]UBQ44621.1 hypothetical protein LCH15_26065 [Comamonas thiooxydans]
MTQALKLLKTMLRDSNLEQHAQISVKNNQAIGTVTHPVTGKTASFAVGNMRTRERHALANQAARIRRFSRLGQDLATGQSYSAHA